MKTAINASLCFMTLACIAAGCAAPNAQRASMQAAVAEQFVALTVLGPERIGQAPEVGFRLGAGDSLGQAVYENYVSIVRANPKWQYASGEQLGQ